MILVFQIAGGILLALIALVILPPIIWLGLHLLPFAILIYFLVTEPAGTFTYVLFMALIIAADIYWRKKRAAKKAAHSSLPLA